MEAKKVTAEVVDEGGSKADRKGGQRKKFKHRFGEKLVSFVNKIKIIIAVCLDLADLVFGNIPLINTLWDFFTVMVLMITLKNKSLAFMALAELPLLGIPPFGFIDSLIPIATILTLADIAGTNAHVIRR